MVKKCPICKKEFRMYRYYQTFCSRKCYRINEKIKNIPKPYKNGRRKHGAGYIWIRSLNHPFHSKAGYVFEHRLVMEKQLGRYLSKKEWVHHKNGIKDDNSPANLILLIKGKNWHPQNCPKCGFEFLIK